MKFYCGMDLGARNCHVCVIDEDLYSLIAGVNASNRKMIVMK